MNKTNAMRKLDKAGIKYEPIEYVPDDSDLSGVHIAKGAKNVGCLCSAYR